MEVSPLPQCGEGYHSVARALKKPKSRDSSGPSPRRDAFGRRGNQREPLSSFIVTFTELRTLTGTQPYGECRGILRLSEWGMAANSLQKQGRIGTAVASMRPVF